MRCGRALVVASLLAVSAPTGAKPVAPGRGPVPCIQGEDQPVLVSLEGPTLRLCSEHADRLTCVGVDLGRGGWSSVPAPRTAERPLVVPSASVPTVEIADDHVTVCRVAGSPCTTLRPKGDVDPGLGISAGVNASGTLAALSYLDTKPQVETFDLVRGKRIGRFRAGSNARQCVRVEVLGDTVYVDEAGCGESVSTAWLGTPAGKKIAAVGGKRFHPAGTHVHIEGTTWAFASIDGASVVLQDVKSGKVKRRITIGQPGKEVFPVMVGDAKRLVLAFAGSRKGDVVVIDLATDKPTLHPGHRCR